MTNKPKDHQLGDAPIEPEYIEMMQTVARGLDKIFNGDATGTDRKIAFVLLVTPFGDTEGRCNFVSNGIDRKDIVALFKEMIARFEGQPEVSGRA